jgi:hypothetical protein
MRKFNRGYALFFLLVLIAAYFGMRWTYQRAEPYFSAKAAEFASYDLDDWLTFFKLDETLGEPDFTPVPADQYPFTITPRSTGTPTTTVTPKPQETPTATPAPES